VIHFYFVCGIAANLIDLYVRNIMQITYGCCYSQTTGNL